MHMHTPVRARTNTHLHTLAPVYLSASESPAGKPLLHLSPAGDVAAATIPFLGQSIPVSSRLYARGLEIDMARIGVSILSRPTRENHPVICGMWYHSGLCPILVIHESHRRRIIY